MNEQALLTTSYLPIEEDYVAFQLIGQKQEMHTLPVFITRILGFLLILLGVGGFAFLNSGLYAKAFFTICIIAGLAVAFYHDSLKPYLIRRRARKFFQTEGRRFVAQNALFFEDRVEISTDRYQGALPYTLYCRVVEDEKLFVFYTGEGEARFLPKRVLSDEQRAVLRNLMQTVLDKRFVVLPS